MRSRGQNQCYSADMIIQFTYTHTFCIYRHEACGFLYLQTYIYVHVSFLYTGIYQNFIHVWSPGSVGIQDVLDRSTCNAYVYIYTYIHTHLRMHMFVDLYM